MAFGLSITADVANEIVDHVINDLPSDGTTPPPPLYSQFQANYASDAATIFNESTPALLDSSSQRQTLVATALAASANAASANEQPFVLFRGPNETDPYIPQNMNAKQLAAFNAWLSNPVVFEYFYHPGPAGAEELGYDAITTVENQSSD